MTEKTSVRDILGLWSSRPELARDLNEQPGETITVDRVHKWAQAGAIPATYHGRILRAGQARGFDLTADDLVRAHDDCSKGAAA